MCTKYIVFKETQIGHDGCRYISGVKYAIQLEDEDSIYMHGKRVSNQKTHTNRFLKKDIQSISAIGNIIKESKG